MMFKYFVEGSEEFKKELAMMDAIIGPDEDFDPEMVNDEETAETLVISALIYKENAKPQKGLVDACKAMVTCGDYTFLGLHRHALKMEEIEGGDYEANLEQIVMDWMDSEKERDCRDEMEASKGFCHEDDLPF